MDHRYVYILLRTDIPIQHQMAQACHGALEAGKMSPECRGEPDSVVVLGLKNKYQLLKAQAKLKLAGIKTAMFWEPDWDYGHTAFGTEPLTEEQRQHLKGYRLWKP